jgi:hypothetical protein
LPRVFGLTFPETASSQIAVFFASATRTSHAIRPAHRDQKILAVIRVSEVADRFDQGVRPCPIDLDAVYLAEVDR